MKSPEDIVTRIETYEDMLETHEGIIGQSLREKIKELKWVLDKVE